MKMRAVSAMVFALSLSAVSARAECDDVCRRAADALLDMQAQIQRDIGTYRNALLALDNAGASTVVKDDILREMAVMRDTFLAISNAPPLNAAPWNQPVGQGLKDLFPGQPLGNVSRAEFWLGAKQRGYDGPLTREGLKEWLAAHPDQQERMSNMLAMRQRGYNGPFGGLDYMGAVCFMQGHCDADGRPLTAMTGHDLTEHADGDPNYRPVASANSGGNLTDVQSAGHAATQ